MTRDVTLHVDDFGQHALERFTRRSEGSIANAVRMASIYYLSDRDARRAAWRVPRVAADSHSSGRLRIQLDDATWASALRGGRPAGRSNRSSRMHALLYYLADIDSGRVAALLEDALENTE